MCPQILTPETISNERHHDLSHCGSDLDTDLSVHAVSETWYPWSKFYKLLWLIILDFYQVLRRPTLPKSGVYGKQTNKQPLPPKKPLIIIQRIGLLSR